MRRNIAPVLGFACVILLVAGCHGAAGTGQPAYCAESSPAEDRTMTEPSDPEALSVNEDAGTAANTGFLIPDRMYVLFWGGRTGMPGPLPEKADETALSRPVYTGTGPLPAASDERAPRLPGQKESAQALEDAGVSKHQNQDGGGALGPIQRSYHPLDVPPRDTVTYTASRKEEITDTRYVESVVDEKDPDTYEIVETEQSVPSMYVNHAGDIKYAFEDGVWYEYKYSSGNVSFASRNDKLALMLLKPRGTYDRLEVAEMDCTEEKDENGQIQYRYYVRYCGICAMDRAPSETSHLASVDLGIVAATMRVKTQTKVPVLMEVTEGTGEYRYYGWQELGGEVYYFDEHGKKVTGQQVIRGIRHEFDRNGVKISRAGVEVSGEHGMIDWERAAGAKIDLALIRCAYRDSVTGQLILDAQAEKNLTGAKEAGLETGIWLFSQAVTMEEAIEEAEFLIHMAEKYEVEGPVALTAAYANPERNGRADQVGREERTAYIAAGCQAIEEAGYTPVLHTDEAFLAERLDAGKLSDCQLWLTGYDPDLTYTGPCAIRQYTDRGTVDGISGYTGLNISYGK